MEGGLIASFGTDAKTPIIISEDAKYDDGVVMEAVVEKFVKYFKAVFHHNSWYFFYFVMCKFLKSTSSYSARRGGRIPKISFTSGFF